MFTFNICSNQIKYALLIYFILISVYIYFKPKMSFRQNGSLKNFGTSNSENVSIFPLWIICFLFAIISYYIVIFICNIKKNRIS